MLFTYIDKLFLVMGLYGWLTIEKLLFFLAKCIWKTDVSLCVWFSLV